MIKKLLSIAVLLTASACSIYAQAPKLEWASIQDGKGIEMGVQVEKTTDGNVVIMNEFYSAESYLNTDYSVLNLTDGTPTSQKTLYGAPDVAGANGNANMSLYKIDTKTGNLIWSLYTNKGSFSNNSCMTTTPDNGVVLFLKMRHTSLGALYPETLCQFVDKDSTLTAIDWTNSTDYEYAPYYPVLVKINAEGKIEWTKRFDVKYGYWDVLGKKTKHTDCFDLGGVASDKNGNLYITGIYRTDINFGENANFMGARNAAKWDGDSQDKRGDMFIAKLDPNGESIWGTTTAGDTILCENPKGIAVVGDKLYISGIVKGNGKSTIVWGENKFIPGDRNNLFITELSAETGQYDWVKVYNGANTTTTSSNIKPMGMSAIDGKLYFYGSFQAEILDGENVILTNEYKKLNSYIIKCDATDGSFLNALRINNPKNKNSILEVEAVHAAGNKVYAVGYDLMGDSYNYIMDENLSNLETHTVKKSFFGSTQGAAYIGDKVINVTRMKNTVTIPGFDWTYNSIGFGNNRWACMYTCHTIEGMISTGIESVDSENEGEQVIYDLSGRRVAKATKGLYIINGKKVFVR